MAPHPTSTWTRTNTDNVTVVDADYMDDSDGEITAIEASLGVDLVPGTTAPLVDYLRVRDDTSSVNHVFLAHSEVSDTRVSIGPVDLDGLQPNPLRRWVSCTSGRAPPVCRRSRQGPTIS